MHWRGPRRTRRTSRRPLRQLHEEAPLSVAAGAENRPTIGLPEIGSSIASRLRRHRTRGPRVGSPSLRSARAGRARASAVGAPMTRPRVSRVPRATRFRRVLARVLANACSTGESQSGYRRAPSRLHRV